MWSLCHVTSPSKSFKQLASDSGSCWQGSAGTGATVGCTDSLVGLHARSSAASTWSLFLPRKNKTPTFSRVRFLWNYYYVCVSHVQSYLLGDISSNPDFFLKWNLLMDMIQKETARRGEYLGCLRHGVNSRKLALLQLVFTNPTLPSLLHSTSWGPDIIFQNLVENGKQIKLSFSFPIFVDKRTWPLLPMPKITQNVLSLVHMKSQWLNGCNIWFRLSYSSFFFLSPNPTKVTNLFQVLLCVQPHSLLLWELCSQLTENAVKKLHIFIQTHSTKSTIVKFCQREILTLGNINIKSHTSYQRRKEFL